MAESLILVNFFNPLLSRYFESLKQIQSKIHQHFPFWKSKSLTEIRGWRRCELGVGGAVGGAESFTAPTQEPGKMSISGSLAALQAASIDFTQQMDILSDC